MDPTLGVAIIGAVASVIVAVVANRFTARSAQAAQRRTAEIESTKVDAEAYKRARESYDAALETQAGQIAQMQIKMSEDRGEYRQAIADCKERIRELEEARRNDQMKIRTLIAYMRDLIALLRVNQIPVPVQPVGLDIEF